MKHQWLLGLPRGAKQGVMIGADLLVLPFILWISFVLRLEALPPVMAHPWLLLAAPLLTIPVLWMFGFYRAVIRHLSGDTAISIVLAMTLASALLAAAAFMLQAQGTPRSVFVIYWALGILYLGGSRFMARRYLRWLLSGDAPNRVVIYGAGTSAIQLVTALRGTSTHGYLPLAFVDDNPSLQGSEIQGLPVLSRKGLARWVAAGRVSEVLLAIPSATRAQRLDVVAFVEQLNLPVKSIPSMQDLLSGKAKIAELRELVIEDLLGRDPVPPDEALLGISIAGNSVLVTGAGGSIGSELCRQIILLSPRRLVLLEHNECGLYEIEKELRGMEAAAGVEIVPVLGSVLTSELVYSVARDNQVETLYHAAAYKHVPMVEHNPAAGVRNNVLGTWAVADAARRAGVRRCILVSTDKAVRPTNVMGASKRFAELVLQAMATRPENTIFTMVRFGNVLGSSGSVVPLFRRQIAEGGPVTVTHPDMTRYFMTIPEASQLVIQAGAMARGGEVFVLDMGEPVRIRDLARTMIGLMGLTVRDENNPEGDIAIEYSGVRPGEKLYEELLIGDDPLPTRHRMIMQARETCLPWREVEEALTAFREAVENNQPEVIRRLLRSYVDGYQPTPAEQARVPSEGGLHPLEEMEQGCRQSVRPGVGSARSA